MDKKFTFLVLLLCCFYCCAVAQVNVSGSVSGKVADSRNGIAIEFAVVKLQDKDSVVVATVVTNKAGYFKIEGQKLGSYTLKISFLGYTPVLKNINVTTQQSNVDLGKITLNEGIALNTVIVKGITAPIKIRRDTLEYDATAFKTAPNANVETMFRQIPGVEVDPYGKIKIHGLDLSRVTVEGKKFFGNSYNIATQNLPADAIAKVQIIESKTEEAIRSGIDDGKREKVINLVLKEDKKGGYFGTGSLAGGTKERYLTSGSINHFSPNTQVNTLLMSNNNNQAYSVGEAGSFSGNDFGKGAVSGEINGIPFGRISQGLTKTNSGAINFSRQWGDKEKNSFSSSYIGSLIDSKTDVATSIQNLQTNQTFLNNTSETKKTDRRLHFFSADYTRKIDSLTTYSFSPEIKLEQQNSLGNSSAQTLNANDQLVNTSLQQLNSDDYTPTVRGLTSLRRKLKKGLGSYYLSLSYSYTKNEVNNYNLNDASFYVNGIPNSNSYINQLQNNGNLNNILNFSAQFNRFVSMDKKTSLVTTASISNSNSNVDQYTFDYNPMNDRYEIVVPDLTNVYKNRLTQSDVSVGINKSNNKTTFIATANVRAIMLNGDVIGETQQTEINRDYLVILPRITFSYRSDSRKSINIYLTTNLNAPSIADLQPVVNNLNRFYIRQGNPLLKPAKTYSAQASYNAVNVQKGSYSSHSISLQLYRDNFSNDINFDEATAVSYVKRINVNGNYNLSFSSSFGKSIKQIKGLNLSYGVSASNQRAYNYLNSLRNHTTSTIFGANAGISYSYKESLVIGINNRSSYIDARNSVQQAVDNSYFMLSNTGNLSYGFIKKWRLAADLTHQANLGRNDDFKQSVLLVNAGIQRFLMPKEQFVIELKGYDLFNQNSNISRSITANTIQDTQSLNLRRYFLLRFTYKVNKLQAK